RRRCLLLVQVARRHDAREWPALPRHGPLARRHDAGRGDVQGLRRTRAERGATADRAGIEGSAERQEQDQVTALTPRLEATPAHRIMLGALEIRRALPLRERRL